MPLPMILISTKSNTLRLHVCCTHAVCDGRTIEGLYRIVAHVFDNSVNLPVNTALPSFHYQELFAGISDDTLNRPFSRWKTNPTGPRILPDDKNVFYSFAADYTKYTFHEIQSFCSQMGVGVNSVLMCAYQRAYRKYYKLSDDVVLIAQVPSDTRRSSYASDTLKTRELFCASAPVRPLVTSQKNLFDEILECNKRLKEILSTEENCVFMRYSADTIDEKNGSLKENEINFSINLPMIGMSNIGQFKYTKNARVMLTANYHILVPPCVYSYNEGNVLNLYFMRSDPMPKELLQTVFDTFDDVFGQIGATRI
ncbi:hypothetical protein EIN_415930 [Entamoeba invadens IP1]|uniref:Condensation domain-containing protein n=1 Tax=Entamoeba invadens IP1 TaxID=370355 RepID=A0A0A1U131_ENTIV|nr:hypothetical protein EIN_415930 [Entamoeba invadens IP1]ELP87720.1 hypothetical protein EIN_415930 [Entamoeba invadens IP1]|eukprot:XP_004254491.1 hypothetical protein EIN_415930 [Entamoeba invadens IP1]